MMQTICILLLTWHWIGSSFGLHLVGIQYRKVSVSKFHHSLLSRAARKDDDTDDAPFLSALQKGARDIKHRYFFPGHHGGMYAPSQLASALQGSPVLALDLPELDETDNIHAPESCLAESLASAAKLFGAKRTWYLVNGSTSGIHIAMLAAARRFRQRRSRQSRTPTPASQTSQTPTFLIARDAHKSVFDGLALSDSRALLLPVEVDDVFQVSLGVHVAQLLQTIDKHHSEIAAVVLTRPSYQGLLLRGDMLRNIVALCRKHDVPVIVDEAHGGHLKFMQQRGMEDALSCGADVVVQSTHKTLNSLTQTAMLHAGADCLIDDSVLQLYFSRLTTTSPNSLLLGSLDSTQAEVRTAQAQAKIQAAVSSTMALKEWIGSLGRDHVRLLDHHPGVIGKQLQVDPLRLSVQYGNENIQINSVDIDDMMCENDGIFCELNLPQCITYILGMYCSSDSLLPLKQSIFKAIEHMQSVASSPGVLPFNDGILRKGAENNAEVSILMSESECLAMEPVRCPLRKGDTALVLGSVCAETICVYPPGIPLVITGEKLTQEKLEALLSIQEALRSRSDERCADAEVLASGRTVTGCSDITLQTLLVYASA